MKKLGLSGLVLMGLLAFAGKAEAQLASNEVYAGSTFKIAADHDGLNTTEYRLYRNGALSVTLPRTSLASGVIAFDQPSTLAAGSYVYYVEAKGDGGVAASVTYTVVIKALPPKPNAPTLPRLIRPTQ